MSSGWGAISHSSSLSFLLIRISEKQSREYGGQEIKSPAWLWQERQDLLWNRVIMRLTHIPLAQWVWLCLSGLCDVSALSPSGSGVGPGATHTHSEWFRKPRRLSGMAVDLRLVLWCWWKNTRVCDLIGKKKTTHKLIRLIFSLELNINPLNMFMSLSSPQSSIF